MAKNKHGLEPCCDMFIPFGYSHNFIKWPVWHTIICINCNMKARGRTLDKAIENWNKKVTRK